MLEKNVQKFSKVFEDMDMKKTGDIFKREFLAKSNDEYELGKITILKQLQKELNKCTGINTPSNYFTTTKKVKPENPIFQNLLKKISNNRINQQKIQKEESKNSELKVLNPKSKLYLNLSSKIKKQHDIILKNKSLKLNLPGSSNYNGNIEDPFNDNDDEDLPMFGSKIKNDDTKEFLNNDHLLTLEGDEENNDKNNDNNIHLEINNDSLFNDSQNESFKDTSMKLNRLTEADLKNNYDNTKNKIDEYENDDDPGYDLYECDVEYFQDTCQKLSEDNDFPHRGIYKSKYTNYKPEKMQFPTSNKNISNSKIKLITYNPKDKENKYNVNSNINQDDIWKNSKLSKNLNFSRPATDIEQYYPIYYNKNFIDSYALKVVVDRERTGFEESKDFKIVINTLIAGRYQIRAYLDNAAFSKVVKCLDTKEENKLVCLKIIENNKNYFDRALEEIKILQYVNNNGDSDKHHFLKLYDYFYFKEHLFIVTELLNDNLYEFYDYLLKNKIDDYFTLNRIQQIAKQVLTSLNQIHSLHLIHCDLKPENILFKSITNTEIKIIDFGSATFIHDKPSTEIQSLSYRAPEVVLGCKYDYKIDIWSLGCILAELYSKLVLFQSDSVHSLLARIIGIIGPIPDWMYEKGTKVNGMFCKEKLLFMEVDANNESEGSTNAEGEGNGKKMHVIVPKRTMLKNRIHCDDKEFIGFLRFLLKIDPNERPTAAEALKHKWFNVKYD